MKHDRRLVKHLLGLAAAGPLLGLALAAGGCGVAQSETTPAAAAIPARIRVESRGDYRLIEVTYRGHSHLYIQPYANREGPLTPVASYPVY